MWRISRFTRPVSLLGAKSVEEEIFRMNYHHRSRRCCEKILAIPLSRTIHLLEQQPRYSVQPHRLRCLENVFCGICINVLVYTGHSCWKSDEEKDEESARRSEWKCSRVTEIMRLLRSTFNVQMCSRVVQFWSHVEGRGSVLAFSAYANGGEVPYRIGKPVQSNGEKRNRHIMIFRFVGRLLVRYLELW